MGDGEGVCRGTEDTHLLLSVDVGVQQTDDELEVRLLAADERHAGQLMVAWKLSLYGVAKSWLGGSIWRFENLVVD